MMQTSKPDRKELLNLLELLQKEERALDSGKLSRYNPHGKQLEFHKSNKKIRVLLGGNRCLREDQRIITKHGPVSIGDIGENQMEVLSYNQKSNQHEWSLAGVPFVKGKSQQYRVIHEAGEFVADGSHLIFSDEGRWRRVDDLFLGEKCFFCHPQTIEEFYLKAYAEGAGRWKKKAEDSEGDYPVCNYLYGRQPLVLSAAVRLFLKQYSDAMLLASSAFQSQVSRHQFRAGRESPHTHLNLLKSLLSSSDEGILALGHFGFAEGDQISSEFFRQIFAGLQSLERFLLKIDQATRGVVCPLPTPEMLDHHVSYQSSLPITTIKAIEKFAAEEWYWDLTVPGNHNFVTSDGSLSHNSGKTTATVLEVIQLCLGTHAYHPIPVPCRIKMYGDSFPTVMETFVPKFEEWIPREFLDDRKPYEKNQMQHVIGVNFKNGSEIRIGSYDQEERKAEGSRWDAVCFDEPPSRELYIANMRGLVDTGGLMTFSLTPLSEPWIYDEIYVPAMTGEKDYIECWTMRSDENPHIDHDALNLFLDELTPEEREVRFEGKFKKLTGLVIDTYDPAVHDIDEFNLDYGHVVYEGIDPHPMKPHCVLWKAIDRNGWRYVVDELAFPGSLYDLGAKLVEKRTELCKHGAVMGGSVVDTIINSKDMANRLNMKDELVRGIRDAGGGLIPSSAMKMDQFNPGIEKERDLFRTVKRGEMGNGPMQFVFKRCKKYKYELLHYQWPENINDNSKPLGKNDDFISCARYLESIGPHYHTPGSNLVRNNVRSYRKMDNFDKLEMWRNYGTR